MEINGDAAHAFVDSVEKAVQPRATLMLGPSQNWVGCNESKRGEGYIRVQLSNDIAEIVREVTGEDPIRVLTHNQITAAPDMWGLQGTRGLRNKRKEQRL